ncbi:t-SNARE [Sistotremastrum niveocremeum HHB9708]|uniref:t-SNARE n=1 Tax=Sistotremastrum niveocremeum HHB9708 TaxID=1314777 RepID=A0A165A116_9AGAM|nr:t-SNARE [Sistotremastrum niveocremeum HHB9708]
MASAPTTRSRTLLFLSYRDSRAPLHRRTRHARSQAYTNDDDDDESQGLIPGAQAHGESHLAVDMTLPPMWFDISDQVNEILDSVAKKISSLEKLHARHALPGFSDRTAEEREIEAVTSDITRGFLQCQTLIQRIAPRDSHHFPPKASNLLRNEELAAHNVQRGLAAKVQDMSASFRKKQRVYMDKLQGHSVKNQDLLIASGALSLSGSDSITALEDDMQAASQSQVSARVDPSLRTRDRELTEIAKSIASLAELFKDLSSLVIDQGTILDSVEYNIEQTSVHMQEAVKELEIATTYQKNTGRRQCIFLLILIILGLILILIFKPRRGADSPHSQDPQLPSSSAGSMR